ncbi:MAG: hypothetical protein JJ908_14175 [Rhizobiales bacterium]|nr:hypothetical protein [Hyphomicrobiales bacterium]MBO6700322.1 hypothetical protein [Hyphomicrobiales bacterium]MBO6737513.1 hypothetical protein [Hyphomicrobiales bacterium]MBO6913430.1 hypothetical protein [Hyphomicrobiales bacterium]MBO6955361.1 hypothetical protein [Hyphomicrobiales bacterium]
MPHLKSLTLTPQTPRSERSPLERKRLRLIQRLETQLKAAEAALAGETYTEEVKHWVTHQETGEKTLLTQQRPVKPWWWQDDKGQWLITLRDGNRVLPISKEAASIAVGSKDKLLPVLATVLQGITAGELDEQLELAARNRKAPPKRKS